MKEMREAFEAWHEVRRKEILRVAEEIRLQMIANGYSDSTVTAAEATFTAIERVTRNNDSFVIYQAAWQHCEAKAKQEALEQSAIQQAKIDSLQSEIERLTKCLVSANKEFELYERKYYLEVNKVENLTEEIERLHQPVSDEQIAEIHSELYSIYSEEEITYDDFAKTIRSILERK